MSVLDAFSCPYCGAALLRESYTVRCGSEHRFTARLLGTAGRPSGGAGGASPADAAGCGAAPASEGPAVAARAEGAEPASAAEPAAPRRFQLRVVGHPDRAEIGRLHVFLLEDA